MNITLPGHTPELWVGYLGLVLVGCFFLWLMTRWVMQGPRKPDPWGPEISQELETTEATALCHRCLSPHDDLTEFCPECGAPVGNYTNLLPFPYLFSIGHTLRIGTSGEYRHSGLIIIGFIILAIAEYSIFAPVYWFVFLRKLFHSSASLGSQKTASTS